MSDTRNRSVSLPVDALDKFKELASARDMSVSAWLVEAGERQIRREWSAAAHQYCAQPEIAAQLAEIDAYCDEANADYLASLERAA